MAGCCDPRGCDRMFGERFARRLAARYRKRGLDTIADRMVDLLVQRGVEGATVLEIGGGVGEIQLELLRRGAASATNLELSPGYETEARRLLDEAGLTDRVRRRVVDIVETPDDVEQADIVVLHRVVCCYPDFPRLLGAAAVHARHQLVFSFPTRNALSRGVIATQNRLMQWSGRRYRAYVHPPSAMLEVLSGQGLHAALSHRGAVWQVAAAYR